MQLNGPLQDSCCEYFPPVYDLSSFSPVESFAEKEFLILPKSSWPIIFLSVLCHM